MKIYITPILCLLIALVLSSAVSAQKDQIGFNLLQAEKGGTLPTGSGLNLLLVEAPTNAPTNTAYLPNENDAQFNGKTITDETGNGIVSGHANTVAQFFFGSSSSLAPGINDISAYNANDWIFNTLGFQSGNDPTITPQYDVGNHSYVGRASATFTAPMADDILERFDFVINRDNTVMTVGADNGAGSNTPRVLAPSFNAITVGLSNGNHSTNLTPADQTYSSTHSANNQRFAVDLVVPVVTVTSNATPVVGSAAALLRSAGAGTDFVQNEVIRSTLFAGASKHEFSTWDRTTTRPFDEQFGFGELFIYDSYKIFEGGQFEGSTGDPTTNIGDRGWDYGQFDGTNSLHYDFSIQGGMDPQDVSAVLSWNMDITDIDPSAVFTAARSLANLDLELFDSSGSFLGSLLDQSISTDYANEHIFFQNLAAGDYTFRISGDQATDFGFSWQVVPEPGSAAVISLTMIALFARRRRS